MTAATAADLHARDKDRFMQLFHEIAGRDTGPALTCVVRPDGYAVICARRHGLMGVSTLGCDAVTFFADDELRYQIREMIKHVVSVLDTGVGGATS